ncbi:MAG: SBBP repeat-containing protein, partial [Anaerolineae bacterium]
DGSGLAYAAFLGGDGTDRAYGLAVDQNGRVVVTGETQSDDFPVSGGASVCTGGEGDAFVAQLNPQGERLAFSTCLGGSARDEGLAVAADSLGQVYVAGKTSSPDFPVSEGALAETPAGQGDAFVVKLNPATGDLRYATFLGGSSIDRAEAIAVDSAGRATVAGSTISPDFPATPNAFAASPHKGYEAFVARLNADGSGLVYATFLGGSSGDRAYAVAVDGAGRAYVTGATYSQNFPATPAAFDGSYNYGYADSFFVRLNPDGSGLEYATFLGGSEPGYGMAVALDGEGSAYLAGATRSPTYPATVRGADPTHNGDWDGFVTKIAFEKPPHTALISGIIRDPQGSPVPGVVVSAGAEGSTTTDANGVYVLIGLNPGTYTLTPIKSGYAFSPPRRTLNVPTAESLLVFTGVPQGDPPDPFLDLPLDYGHSPAAFVQALQDADSQGWITSWFDHAYPDYGKNRRLTLPDGLPRAGEGFNLKLGCYERRCYDGHDGLDLIYRDFRPGVTNLPAVKVFAAAAGRVAATRTGCTVGNKRCGEGFGNYVVLAHPNGYFTLYGHLAKVQVNAHAAVAQGDAIGFMGNTGNSSGFHLHFGVYRDGGNGAWDGFEAEQPVDPFGWQGSQADPWVVDRQGPVSAYLWRYPLAQQKSFVGSRGTALSDAAGAVEATIPAGAFE